MKGRRLNDSAADFIKPKIRHCTDVRRVVSSGFTIVELLIVVVVIAVLAAITIVAYNGITANARESALRSDITTAAKQLQLARVDSDSFPESRPSYLGDSIQYSGGGESFCITASRDGRALRMTQNGAIQDGTCPGHIIAGDSGGPASLAVVGGGLQGSGFLPNEDVDIEIILFGDSRVISADPGGGFSWGSSTCFGGNSQYRATGLTSGRSAMAEGVIGTFC